MSFLKRITTIIILLAAMLLPSCKFELSVPDDGSLKALPAHPVSKIKITYAVRKDELSMNTQLVEKYNKSRTDREVVLKELDSDDPEFYSRIVTDYQSGLKDYDVYEIDFAYLTFMAQSGVIAPLDNEITAYGLNFDSYLEQAMNAVSYAGKIYAFPKSVYLDMLFYRNDLVALTPNDFSELIRYAAPYDGTVKGIGYAGGMSDSLAFLLVELIHYNGGAIFAGDKCVINSDAAVKTLNSLYQVQNSDFAVKDIGTMTRSSVGDGFLNGSTVFMLNGPLYWARCRESLKISSSYTMAVLPSRTDANALISGKSVALGSNCQIKDEAMDFIQFVLDYQKTEALGGVIPADTGLYSDEDVISVNSYIDNANFKSMLKNAVILPKTAMYGKFTTILKDELYYFLNGNRTAENMLEYMEERINSVFKD